MCSTNAVTCTPMTTSILNNHKISIGQGANGARSFNGNIDEVSIWSRELTICDASDLYNCGNGLAYQDVMCFYSVLGPSITAIALTRGDTISVNTRGDTAVVETRGDTAVVKTRGTTARIYKRGDTAVAV